MIRTYSENVDCIKRPSLQYHFNEFYFLPLYSLCSTIFSYSFFSKDSKSEISKGLCGAPARSRTADLLITNQQAETISFH